jgi:hypothetical protein
MTKEGRNTIRRKKYDVISYLKTCDIGKHVFWNQILYWEWEEDDSPKFCQNSYGLVSYIVSPPVVLEEFAQSNV